MIKPRKILGALQTLQSRFFLEKSRDERN